MRRRVPAERIDEVSSGTLLLGQENYWLMLFPKVCIQKTKYSAWKKRDGAYEKAAGNTVCNAIEMPDPSSARGRGSAWR